MTEGRVERERTGEEVVMGRTKVGETSGVEDEEDGIEKIGGDGKASTRREKPSPSKETEVGILSESKSSSSSSRGFQGVEEDGNGGRETFGTTCSIPNPTSSPAPSRSVRLRRLLLIVRASFSVRCSLRCCCTSCTESTSLSLPFKLRWQLPLLATLVCCGLVVVDEKKWDDEEAGDGAAASTVAGEGARDDPRCSCCMLTVQGVPGREERLVLVAVVCWWSSSEGFEFDHVLEREGEEERAEVVERR